MKICEMCNVLFNMSLGLDYADGAGSHKEELDILETEIKEIKFKIRRFRLGRRDRKET